MTTTAERTELQGRHSKHGVEAILLMDSVDGLALIRNRQLQFLGFDQETQVSSWNGRVQNTDISIDLRRYPSGCILSRVRRTFRDKNNVRDSVQVAWSTVKDLAKTKAEIINEREMKREPKDEFDDHVQEKVNANLVKVQAVKTHLSHSSSPLEAHDETAIFFSKGESYMRYLNSGYAEFKVVDKRGFIKNFSWLAYIGFFIIRQKPEQFFYPQGRLRLNNHGQFLTSNSQNIAANVAEHNGKLQVYVEISEFGILEYVAPSQINVDDWFNLMVSSNWQSAGCKFPLGINEIMFAR